MNQLELNLKWLFIGWSFKKKINLKSTKVVRGPKVSKVCFLFLYVKHLVIYKFHPILMISFLYAPNEILLMKYVNIFFYCSCHFWGKNGANTQNFEFLFEVWFWLHFFFRIFKKLSSCFIVDIFDLSLVVSLRSLKGTKMEPTLKMITFYFKKS